MKRSSCASGQRIGAFELDRVLRGQHEERPLELVGAAGGRDVVLLHRLEQRRLRLGRRAVDLVGQDDLREDRARDEPQAAQAVALVEDLGAGDVRRHQVRRELDALEGQVEDLGQRLDQQRLGQTRHAGDQAVPAGEERHQHLVDHLVLPDDDLAQLRQNPAARVGHLLGNPVADCPAAERHSDSLLGCRGVGAWGRNWDEPPPYAPTTLRPHAPTTPIPYVPQCVNAYTISLMPIRYASRVLRM